MKSNGCCMYGSEKIGDIVAGVRSVFQYKEVGVKKKQASFPSGAWYVHCQQIGFPHCLISASPQTASMAGIKKKK